MCVYALVSPAPMRVRITGMSGERLRIVRVDRIGAVVGEVRRAPVASVRHLRQYAAVIDAIGSRVPAILPARFGTTVRDDDELTDILHSRRAALRQRLRIVRARAQMTIRLLRPLGSRLGSDPGDVPYGGQTPVMPRTGVRPRYGATQGTRYLRLKMAAAAALRVVPAFDPIRAAVKPYVKEERVEKRGGIVTINHLIPRIAADTYRDAVRRAAGEQGVRLIVSGPWPPYAFAEDW